MENIECRVISFKQSADEPEHIYFLSDRALVMGCYYYNRDLGRFTCVQKVGNEGQLSLTHQRIEATSNDNYDLPRVPPIFADHYFKNNKTPKIAPLRLK